MNVEVTQRAEKSWERIFMAALILGTGFRVMLYARTHWTLLDALMSFRYAENFGAGRGLVYNAGEWVSGNTSVLYTFVLGIAAACKLDVALFSRVLGTGADLVTVFLLRRLVGGSGLRSPEFRHGLPAAIFLCPLCFPYAVSGMETSLYICLVFWLLERTLHGRGWSYFLAATLAMYCRPDSVLFVAASLLYLGWTTRRIPWRTGAVLFLIGVSYLGFNQLAYGSAIPNSVYAKTVTFNESFGYKFHYLASRLVKFDALFAAWLCAVLGTLVWLRKNALARLLGISTAFFVLFLCLTPSIRNYYIVPFVYLSLLILGLGAGRLVESRWASGSRLWSLVFAAAYLGACLVALPSLFRKCRAVRQYEVDTRMAPGNWLRENTPPGARVFGPCDVGYYSKRYTIDYGGLVEPRVLKMIKQDGNRDYFKQAEALNVDYALLPVDPTSAPAQFQFLRLFAPT
ncbi:MAG: hypothetical protein EPO07_14710, partial [Verrucomicrobia bacterium]